VQSRLNLFWIWVFGLASLPVFAQTRHFRNYSVDDGLAFVQVYTIFQDSKGYLWSGGYGGLSRFNGLTFSNYSPRNGLPNHWVTGITEDKQKNLWVGTIDGASRLRNGKFENFNASNGLAGNHVNCLLQTTTGALWFGTESGLTLYNGINFISLTAQGPGRQEIRCLYEQKNTSVLWIGTRNGIYRYGDGQFTHYPMPALFNDDIKAIAHDINGNLLAGTSDGVFIFEDGRFRLLLPPSSVDMPDVNALFTDNENTTWIGAGNGLFAWDGKSMRRILVARNINAEKIDCIYQDYEGSLWLGTHSGMYRYRGDAFISFGVHEGLSNYFIFGVTEDQSGHIWACSETGGVFRMDDNETFVNYTVKDGLPSNRTNDAETTPDGSVWVGTGNGLARWKNGRFTTYTKKNGLESDTVNTLMTDRKGRLWIGGGQGITLFENEKFTAYKIPPGNKKAFNVWYLTETPDGKIWVGTYLGGLYVFDGKAFTDATALIGLKTESYFSICQDKTGRMFFGTLDGVFMWDGKRGDKISEVDGMNSDLVYAMLLDKEQRYLWIGTNQGLNRFDLETYRRNGTKQITTLGKEEGFMGVECNSNGALLDREGIMWFGTVNGLIRYDPAKQRMNPAYTKTNITDIRLFYEDTVLQSNVELPYSDNNLSFEFVGICLTQPGKVRYRYQLEGFDKTWSPASPENTATYANLPPGKYKFKVISSNNEGLWSPQPAEFTFVIQTPIWQRTWFQLLVVAAALLLIFTMVLLRIRQIKRRERLEAETHVAMSRNELKALRAQMNPHFVFNSLNSIQHFILNNKSADAGKYLNKFARLIRIILYNSEKTALTVREELEYLQLYLDLEALRFENRFTWEVDITDDIDIDYIEIPPMLLQPYIENAILHGLMPRGDNGKLLISFRLQENTMVCSIVDNGIGRERSRSIRQLSKQKDHKSLGMKITNDRLELINRLNGSNLSMSITDLYNETGDPDGTRVDIFIPVS
jgi:ligand-binding sensor domain-containing protein